MTEAADRRVNTYSKGMRQRVGLAQSLAAAPELIILDEPTDGVDPVARRDIRDVLVDARRDGASVLVNSHLLGELELICDRVAILVNGKLAKQGTIDELALGSERYEIELVEHLPVADLGSRLDIQWEGPMPPPLPAVAGPVQGGNGHNQSPFDPRAFSRLPAGTLSPFAARGRLRLNGQAIPLAYDPLTRILRLESLELAPATAALDATRRAGLMIRRFTPVRPTLEDLFIATVTPTITATR
jgi:hypothetical protein